MKLDKAGRPTMPFRLDSPNVQGPLDPSHFSVGATAGTLAAGGDARWGGAVAPESYGAVGDGSTDDTNALQAALDALGNALGGTVQLSARSYRLTGPLTVPPFVSLRGVGPMIQRVIATDVGQITQSPVASTRLLIDFGAGQSDSAPAAVTLQADAAVENLSLYWAGQPLNGTPTPFPPGIRTVDYGFRIAGIEIINGWIGIDNFNSGRGTIRDVAGECLHVGIRTDQCYDWITFDNISFTCLWSGQTGSTAAYRLANLTAFEFGRADKMQLTNCFTFKSNVAFRLRESAAVGNRGGGSYGTMISVTADQCNTSMYVSYTQLVGWDLYGASWNGAWSIYHKDDSIQSRVSYHGGYWGGLDVPVSCSLAGAGINFSMIGVTFWTGTTAGIYIAPTASSPIITLVGNNIQRNAGGVDFLCAVANAYGFCYTNRLGGTPVSMTYTGGGTNSTGTLQTDGVMNALTIYKSATNGIGGQLILNNNGGSAQNATAVTFQDGGLLRGQHMVTSDGAGYAGVHRFFSGQGTLTEVESIWPDSGLALYGGATGSPGANILAFKENGNVPAAPSAGVHLLWFGGDGVPRTMGHDGAIRKLSSY